MKRFFAVFIAVILISITPLTVYADVQVPVDISKSVEEDPYTPSANHPLVAVQADNGGSIILKWLTEPAAAKYTVYIYDDEKGKYCEYESNTRGDGTAYIGDPEPETEYKILVRRFDENNKIIFSEKATVTTCLATPTLTISTVNKPKITWVSNSNKASGYELYVKEESSKDYNPNRDYSNRSFNSIKEEGFRLVKQCSEKASDSVTLKPGKDYTVIVRTFCIVNGEKEYSPFCYGSNTSAVSSYINGLTLKPENVCTGEELELVKKYVDSVITDDMNNYEKIRAIYDLVKSHGSYQYDINKIDGNRPVWQIMVKQEGQCASWAFCLDAMLEYAGFDIRVVRALRDSGQQHFWCQINVNGQWYNLDAHIGSFLSGPYVSSYLGYKIVETY